MEYEILTTNAIQTSIAKTSRLSSYINSGDKEPSWDGNRYLHENEKKTKQNQIEDLHNPEFKPIEFDRFEKKQDIMLLHYLYKNGLVPLMQ